MKSVMISGKQYRKELYQEAGVKCIYGNHNDLMGKMDRI